MGENSKIGALSSGVTMSDSDLTPELGGKNQDSWQSEDLYQRNLSMDSNKSTNIPFLKNHYSVLPL